MSAETPPGPSDTTGAVNVWWCKACGEFTVGIHAEDGVTPMFLACQACGQIAVSLMYPWDAAKFRGSQQPDEPIPEWARIRLGWEWYRPTGREMRTASPEVREHARAGGLLPRPLTRAGREALAARR